MAVKKSFTLIEVLVATTLFVVIMLVFIVAVWQVTRPKVKTDSMSALQETGRLVMTEIGNNILRANGRDLVNGFAFFAITDSNDRAIACGAPQCSGSRLSTYEKFVDSAGVPRSYTHRVFGVNLDGTHPNTLQMKIWGCDGSEVCEPTRHYFNLSEPSTNTDVSSITFTGYYWTLNSSGAVTNDRSFHEYIDIALNLQSHSVNSRGVNDFYKLKTVVSPLYGDLTHNIQYVY